MNWNKAQTEAIELRNKNILVSAAAGSGKTAVLVERIRRLVVDEEVSIDRFLVVTFTNAAASEMKEKIVKSLTKEAQTADDKKLSYIRRQLSLVAGANISTFHGFALEMLRRYFYLTDLEPGFSVCDEDQAEILAMKAADNIFERHFEENSPQFIRFLSRYAGDRNERAAKQMVTDLYRMIMSIPEPFEWLDRSTQALSITDDEFMSGRIMSAILDDSRDAVSEFREYVEEMSDLLNESGVFHLEEKFRGYLESFPAENAAYDEIAAFLEIPFPRMVTTKDEKELLAGIKDDLSAIRKRGTRELNDIKSRYFSQTPSEMAEDLRSTYDMAVFLSELVREYADEFRRLKAEKNLVDFSDIEHYALRILAAEPKVSEEYRKKFRYIFIDEYQDSNDVQEKLIEYISREDNLFMVGDVKQSIYKFRLAEPEIFMEKYHRYASEDEVNSTRIDFNENYRSKRGVIDAVNRVFMGRMEGYSEENRLNKGVAYEGELEYPAEIFVSISREPEDAEIDDEILKLRKEEIEALSACDIIRQNLGTEIYDVPSQSIRKMEYRDMVILMRSTRSGAGVYEAVLEEAGIPVYVDNGEGYFDTVEIEMIENMLRVTDNSRQDYPLIAVLFSPVMGFSVDDLTDIRLAKRDGEFYKAFEYYTEAGKDERLRKKCLDARDTFEKWQQAALSEGLSDLVWSLIWDTGYYTYAGALPGGMQRQANLRALADRTLRLSEQGIRDLYGLITYIDILKTRNIPVGQVKTCSEDDNVVRIMTVHKSKGLEFPLVIAAGSAKKFNLRQKSRNVSCHKRLGFGILNVNETEHWYKKTVLQNLIERQSVKESYEEEKRILYVEYTRAMDKLYILGCTGDYNEEDYPVRHAASPLDFVSGMGLAYHIRTLEDVSDAAAAAKASKEDIRRILHSKEMPSGEVACRLSYTYPYEALTRMKYKYSVTEMSGHMDESVPLRTDVFDETERKLSAAEKGTVTHKVMQYIPFDAEDIDGEIRCLVQKNILSEDEADAVNRTGIKAFLESGIGKRAASAERIWREQPFTMMTELDGTEVMVQGIIDCFFSENGEAVIVDYKNTSVKSDEILAERYIRQLDLYQQAVEESYGMKVKERYLYLLMEGRMLKL